MRGVHSHYGMLVRGRSLSVNRTPVFKMNTQTAPPTPGPPNMPAVPPGWNAEWSVQYAR